MVNVMVTTESGELKDGIDLAYELKPVAVGCMFYTTGCDYNFRVVGFFSGVDHWGIVRNLAEVEAVAKF